MVPVEILANVIISEFLHSNTRVFDTNCVPNCDYIKYFDRRSRPYIVEIMFNTCVRMILFNSLLLKCLCILLYETAIIKLYPVYKYIGFIYMVNVGYNYDVHLPLYGILHQNP